MPNEFLVNNGKFWCCEYDCSKLCSTSLLHIAAFYCTWDLRRRPHLSFDLQFSFCFWMSTRDRENYGTVLSYAVAAEDNEVVFTDYGGFVLAVGGDKAVTDAVADAETGRWGHFCVEWEGTGGRWRIFKDGGLAEEGSGLARGKTVRGECEERWRLHEPK